MRTGRDIFNTPPTRVKTPPTGPPQHRALSASLARPWGLWGPVGPVLGALGLLLGRSWRARGRFWDAWGALECYLVAHGTLVLVFPMKTGGTHWNARRNAPDYSVFPTKTNVAKEWNALERTGTHGGTHAQCGSRPSFANTKSLRRGCSHSPSL